MKHVTLRAVEPEDLELLYRWENCRDLWDTSSTLAPFSRKQLYDYVSSYTADIYTDRQLRLMITDADTNETIGIADLASFSPQDLRAEVGILIAPEYHGIGYGKAALVALSNYASSTLQLHQLYAIVSQENPASLHIFKEAGFKAAGKLRSWLRRKGAYEDAIVLQLLFP